MRERKCDLETKVAVLCESVSGLWMSQQSPGVSGAQRVQPSEFDGSHVI